MSPDFVNLCQKQFLLIAFELYSLKFLPYKVDSFK